MILLVLVGWLILTALGYESSYLSRDSWQIIGMILFVGMCLQNSINDRRDEIAKLTKEIEWQRVTLGRRS